MALLRDVVEPRRLGTSITLVAATLGVDGALGLPFSALVTENFNWHMLFAFATFVTALALVLIWFVVPTPDARTGGRVDVLSVAGLGIGLEEASFVVSQ